jgi:DNA invertase Pin-like site-specific DNA recombinase
VHPHLCRASEFGRPAGPAGGSPRLLERRGRALCDQAGPARPKYARSVEHVARIEAKGAGLRVLSMSLDTTTATGRLMLNVLGSVAELERSMMFERKREGVAKAKAKGKYKGRAPTARAKASEVLTMLASGHGPTEVAEVLNIGRSSVYRVMREHGLAKQAAVYVRPDERQ